MHALPLCLARHDIVLQTSSCLYDWAMVTRCFGKVTDSLRPLLSQFVDHLFPLLCHTDWNCKFASGIVQHATLPVPFPSLCTAKHSPQVVHFFSNIMVGKKSSITPNILLAARSDCLTTPWQQIMISLLPAPYLEKRKCVSNPNRCMG